MKRSERLLALTLIIITGILVDCGEEEAVSEQSYAVGMIAKEIWYFSEVMDTRQVAVFGPMIPYVTMNSDTIPFDFDVQYGGTGTFWDEMPMINGNIYNLKVDFLEYGVLEASATLPGLFSINPSGIYTIAVGSGFTGSWTASDSADWYIVDFSFYYDGYDSLSGWYYHWYDTSFIALTNTSFSVSSSELFPYIPDTIEYGGGHFSVAAINGPIPQSGSYGNITGDGYGFFLGLYYPEETDIEIQGVWYEEIEHEPRSAAFFESLKNLLPNQ